MGGEDCSWASNPIEFESIRITPLLPTQKQTQIQIQTQTQTQVQNYEKMSIS